MISRRSLLTSLPAASLAFSACRRTAPAYPWYAYIANQEGEAIAALDLEVMAVAKHIPLKGSPTEVLTAETRPVVYALTPDTGTLHEISTGDLHVARQVKVATRAHSMALAGDEKMLYITALDPPSLVAVAVDSMQVAWKLGFPEMPVNLAIGVDRNEPNGGADLQLAAISFGTCVRLVDLQHQQLGNPLAAPAATGTWGQVRFLSGAETLIAANLVDQQVSLYRTAPHSKTDTAQTSAQLITHLPIAVRPDNLCFNHDGGQLFVTGEGMDAVVVIYPFDTPRVAETVLAGHAPGAMGVSDSLLFVASPESGDISILNIPTRKVIAITQVGSDPGFITITPNDRYALVLNRKSGDVAVIRIADIAPNRYKAAGLLTVIPVGSKPVSAALHSVG
ncbi:MAG: hypothetical protein ABI824_00485 [Acidobacteriota bacterium]